MLGLGMPPGECPPTSFFLEDVETCNNVAEEQSCDVVKVSAVQALRLKERYRILPCGGAFGLEAGPKVAVRRGRERDPVTTIAVPGVLTTAYSLLRASWKAPFEARPMRYDLIAEAVTSGQVDAGLFIHETALVAERYGLTPVLDLGAWWQDTTAGLPLPLGSIVVRREGGHALASAVAERIRLSLRWAMQERRTLLPLIRGFAQEIDESTLDLHIRTYVNALSLEQGRAGEEALRTLERMARRAFPTGNPREHP